ncbi:Tn3 family transposase [Streptomyces collinus]|uniref:Tn3 family transposase n=1 Tax=Streptomyces collinus TaxID=42684 RepID=UPI003689DB94
MDSGAPRGRTRGRSDACPSARGRSRSQRGLRHGGACPPGAHRNARYAAFREVGRVVRTVQLLRYLTDPRMRRRVTAATNKVEAFNGFSEWVRFGNRGFIADNDPVEQEKAVKFNALPSCPELVLLW